MTQEGIRRGIRLARLPGLEWPLILVAVPLLLFPGGWRTLGLLAVPLFFGLRWARWRRFIDRTPLDVPIVLMTLMVLVSLYATFDIAYSLPKIGGMALGIGVFYAIVAGAADRTSWILAGGAFLLGGVAVAALGLAGTRWIHKFALFESILARLPARLTGLPGAAEGIHPNEVAGVAAVGCAAGMHAGDGRLHWRPVILRKERLRMTLPGMRGGVFSPGAPWRDGSGWSGKRVILGREPVGGNLQARFEGTSWRHVDP